MATPKRTLVELNGHVLQVEPSTDLKNPVQNVFHRSSDASSSVKSDISERIRRRRAERIANSNVSSNISNGFKENTTPKRRKCSESVRNISVTELGERKLESSSDECLNLVVVVKLLDPDDFVNETDITASAENSTLTSEQLSFVKSEPSEIEEMEENFIEESGLRRSKRIAPKIVESTTNFKSNTISNSLDATLSVRYLFRSQTAVKPVPKAIEVVKELKPKTEKQRLTHILQKIQLFAPKLVPDDRWILPCDCKNVAKWSLYIVSPGNSSVGCELRLGGFDGSEVFYYCVNCYEKRMEEVKAYVVYKNRKLVVKLQPNTNHENECFNVDLIEALKYETNVLVNR